MSRPEERQTGIVGDGYYHGGNPCRPGGQNAASAEPPTTAPGDDRGSARPEAPDESWTNRRLRDYAKEHDIDLGDVHKKADMLALIRGA